jgi:hypothetical protein
MTNYIPRIAAVTATVLLAAACGRDNPVAPIIPDPFEMTVTAPETIAADRSGGGFLCTFPLEARAFGGGAGAAATWTPNAAVILYRAGTDEVIGGAVLPQQYYLEAPPRGWGSPSVVTGQTRTMQIQASAPQSYRMHFLVEWRHPDGGEPLVTTVVSRCE